MNAYEEIRCKKVAVYMILHQCTVREAANVFNISKSTVYKDVTERISEVDTRVATRVREVLDRNRDEKTMRMNMAKLANRAVAKS